MNKLAFSFFLTLIFAAPSYPQDSGVVINRLRDRYGVTSEIDNFKIMCNLICISDEYAKLNGLTDEQILKIKPLYIEMEKNNAKLKEEIIFYEQKIREIMNNKDFDLDMANTNGQKITQIKMLHQIQVLKYIKEIRSLLTNEQFMTLNMRISIYSGKNLKEKMLSNKTYSTIYSQK